MTGRARAFAVAALLAAVLLPAGLLAAPEASAHPLGNFTVNRYSGLELAPGVIRLHYVLDMAEIPTFQEGASIDADGDGLQTPAEQRSWADARASSVVAAVSLTVDGRAVPLRVDAFALSFPAGQAGLPTLRLEVDASGPLPPSGSIAYRDHNDADRIGWREITARSADGVAITRSSVRAASVSDELRAYPKDRLSSPPEDSAASLTFRPGGAASHAAGGSGGSGSVSGAPIASGGSFARLVTWKLTPLVLVLSMGLAFLFGAVHALGPGHGKTITAAYLVGSGARAKQAAAVGVAVALMHTASVMALGLVLFVLARSFPPDRIYPWLTLATGAVALGLGAALVVSRIRAAARGSGGKHSHPHPHGHSAPRGDHHDQGPGHVASSAPRPMSGRGLVALAVAGGILPSPTAFVVLTGAVSAHRVGFGLALIAAFSAGLAASLMAVGILAVKARVAVSDRVGARVALVVPVLSALVIVGFGAFFSVQGLAGIA